VSNFYDEGKRGNGVKNAKKEINQNQGMQGKCFTLKLGGQRSIVS